MRWLAILAEDFYKIRLYIPTSRAVHEYHHHHNMAAQYSSLLLPPTSRLPHQYHHAKAGVEPWTAGHSHHRLHHDQTSSIDPAASAYSTYSTMAGKICRFWWWTGITFGAFVDYTFHVSTLSVFVEFFIFLYFSIVIYFYFSYILEYSLTVGFCTYQRSRFAWLYFYHHFLLWADFYFPYLINLIIILL